MRANTPASLIASAIALMIMGASGLSKAQEIYDSSDNTITEDALSDEGTIISKSDGDIQVPLVQWIEEPAEPVLHEGFSSLSNQNAVTSVPRYALQKITIKGNNKTLRQVILRYLDIHLGEIFSADDPRLDMARYRLWATGFFSDVELSLKRGDRRGWVVLIVKVKERNTIVITDFMVGLSEITPYGSLGTRERSFLGTGIELGLTGAVSQKQFAYSISMADNHFLNSDYSLHMEGLYTHARDFFGHESIYVNSSSDTNSYAQMNYDRAGIRLGTGYTILMDYFFWLDLRFESIRADVPPAGSHFSFGERRPIEYGHLLPGSSALSSLLFGFTRDTRDHPLLPSEGAITDFGIELSTEIFGSDYEYSKFTLSHDTFFPLGKGHSIRLGLFAGLIKGDAPFYDQFFVGDYSAFMPSRLLGLNFSHLNSSVLNTSMQEMRYEDMAGSINLEYSIPFYRGSNMVLGVNGFVGFGLFLLASTEDLRTDPKGYRGHQVIPMDLTADIGIKIDTQVGVLIFSIANLFRLIPRVGEGTAE